MRSPLESKAARYATEAHAGQKRKYTDEDYIVHPAAVADLVRSVPHTEEMLAAAWLHDVVEDTPVTLDDIFYEFGHRVRCLVADLTDISRRSDGNRAVRKSIDLVHTSLASAEAKAIKLADLIDNTKSIVAYDPNFAKVYLKEKAALLAVLTDGDPTLFKVAIEQVMKNKRWKPQT